MQKVKISTDFITLGQFLKFVGIIDSGAMAKPFLSTNKVIVNNEEETRRGRKLFNGYIIVVQNKQYIIDK